MGYFDKGMILWRRRLAIRARMASIFITPGIWLETIWCISAFSEIQIPAEKAAYSLRYLAGAIYGRNYPCVSQLF